MMNFLFFAAAMMAQASKTDFDSKVIYGEDNRLEYYESSLFLQSLADSTVGLINTSKLTRIDSGFEMKTSSYAKYFNLCSDEKFYDQQQATWCSGFLIAPDLIATAGHCINSQAECEKTSFVFGFKKPSEGETVTTFQQDAVFQCKELIARTLEMLGADFAIVRLDRPTNRAPLSLSKKVPQSSDELVVIGHPSGLSTKISGGAFLRSESNGFFVANTDTYGGNSGSAVFNAATGEVEGILVRGERDFVWRSTCKVSKKCADDECRGEDITKIAEVIKNLPAQ